MNWLLILVILIIAGNIFFGYRRGFLQIGYTLVEWILILVFIYWASPYVTDFLTEHTGVPERIEAHCLEQLQESVTGALGAGEDSGAGAENNTYAGEGEGSGTGENGPGTAVDDIDRDGSLEQFGVKLPAVLLNNLLEESGTYGKLAEKVTDLAVQGISYLLTLIAAVLIFRWLRFALKLIDKIPVLNGINRFLGIFAGLIKGLLQTWIGFALIAAFAGTAWGKFLISYIYEAPVLTWLYDNNIILAIIMAFL